MRHFDSVRRIRLRSRPRLPRRLAGAGQVHHRRLDDLDRAVRPVRLPAADVQGEDRHRGARDGAGHRPGARDRPPRRRRRGVRPCAARPRKRSSRRARAWSAIEVMYNDFVIVGPERRSGRRARDGRGRRRRSRRSPSAGATFASRGDDSGTHKAELELWEAAGVEPSRRLVPRDRLRHGPDAEHGGRAAGLHADRPRAPGSASRTRAPLEILVEGDTDALQPVRRDPGEPRKASAREGRGRARPSSTG